MYYVKDLLCLPKVLHTGFEPFAKSLGIIVNSTTWPFFFKWAQTSFGMRCRTWARVSAFLLVKRDIQFSTPDILSYDTPLWHSTLFLNQHRHNYFARRLICIGVVVVGQLFEDDDFFPQIAPTWEPIYKGRLLSTTIDQPSLALDHFASTLPPLESAFWCTWTLFPFAAMLWLPHS